MSYQILFFLIIVTFLLLWWRVAIIGHVVGLAGWTNVRPSCET
jgi:hypothetical protein